MLSVKEINEVSFGKAGFSGYKPEDVDNFIDEVAASFQQLEAERDDALKRAQELAAQNAELTAKNGEIQEKLAILAQKIESYREEEDGIKEALLSAQKMAKGSVQEAKDKADLILQDAKDNARQILDNAKIDASRAAKEYMDQVEEKKEELEEMKRQVTAFRSSLLEMYKKHLECIDHIPSFRPKEKPEAPQEEQVPQKTVPERQAEPEPEPIPEREPEPVPAPPVKEEPVEAPTPAPAPKKQQIQQPRRHSQPARQAYDETPKQPTLHDRVDYSREQDRVPESGGLPEEDDLSEVGIDLKTYSDIPESLRREKSTNFSNLEFGDDVDLGQKKRKR